MKRKEPVNIFDHFFKNEAAAGFVLLFFAIAAIVIANNDSFSSFHNIWHEKGSFSIASFKVEMDLIHWINDGLMAVFFFLVGMEIKREVLAGELSSIKHASLPIFAAIGGMIVPAAIFLAFNLGTDAQNGWGIPMATDIAFSIGVLSMLGKRVPVQLKIFLTALAIVDDLGAILVLAFFYPAHEHNYTMFLLAGAIILILWLVNRKNITSLPIYLILGVALWLVILFSGIHATLAGVLLAMFIPFRGEKRSLMSQVEHTIHPWVTFLILPVFALSNAGVKADLSVFSGSPDGLTLGIFFGLLLGKPIGITGMSWLAYKLNLADKPSGVKWSQIFSVGIIAGIGFTMSIFIDNLAFSDQSLIETGKVAILMASFVAAVIGSIMLIITTKKKKIKPNNIQ